MISKQMYDISKKAFIRIMQKIYISNHTSIRFARNHKIIGDSFCLSVRPKD